MECAIILFTRLELTWLQRLNIRKLLTSCDINKSLSTLWHTANFFFNLLTIFASKRASTFTLNYLVKLPALILKIRDMASVSFIFIGLFACLCWEQTHSVSNWVFLCLSILGEWFWFLIIVWIEWSKSILFDFTQMHNIY